MNKYYLLGASGSIGKQTIDVIRTHKLGNIIGISFGKDLAFAKKIILEFNPRIVCMRTKNDADKMIKLFEKIDFCYGDEGLIKIAKYKDSGIFINALMGSVGLVPTVNAIKTKKDIALANKETLVMAGDIIKDLVKEYNVKLLPIDSEHSAIWQCLKGEEEKKVKRIIITASGGSFRNKTRTELEDVTVKDALNHPNWSMGKKITIDSATMMNKGLEVIEAHHLFNISYDKIDTILHKESIIHSMIEFNDSTVKAQLATPDMRMPILYALNYGKRMDFDSKLELTDMHFEKIDLDRFPCLKYAYKAGKMGGIAPVVVNAANEAAVNLFLNGEIKFLQIEEIIEKELASINNYTPTLDDIIKIDKEIKGRYKNGYNN